MRRWVYRAYALACYAAFFAVFLYFIGFLVGYPGLATHIDRGIASPWPEAVLIDTLLVAAFGLQHSGMARQRVKQAMDIIVPPALNRATYCLVSSAALLALCRLWHPVPAPVWQVTQGWARVLLWGLCVTGIVITNLGSWLHNHFELFGLQQAWDHASGRQRAAPAFATPILYRLVRHPIYTGFLVMIWATPEMSVGHLVLSLCLTAYILIGIQFEEADLIARFGADYRAYRQKIPMLLPIPRGGRGG